MVVPLPLLWTLWAIPVLIDVTSSNIWCRKDRKSELDWREMDRMCVIFWIRQAVILPHVLVSCGRWPWIHYHHWSKIRWKLRWRFLVRRLCMSAPQLHWEDAEVFSCVAKPSQGHCTWKAHLRRWRYPVAPGSDHRWTQHHCSHLEQWNYFFTQRSQFT